MGAPLRPADILARGLTYSLHLPTAPEVRAVDSQLLYPLTVAGPRWCCTIFPRSIAAAACNLEGQQAPSGSPVFARGSVVLVDTVIGCKRRHHIPIAPLHGHSGTARLICWSVRSQWVEV